MSLIAQLVKCCKHVTVEFDRKMEEEMTELEAHFRGKDNKTVEKEKTNEKPGKETEKQEGCTDGDKTYQQGEQWTDAGVCNLKVCHPRGVVSVRKCPEWKVPPPCRQQDLHMSDKFPECCPSVVCPTSS